MPRKLPIFPGPASEKEELEDWEKSVRNAIPINLYDSVEKLYDEEEFLRYLRIVDESFGPDDLMAYPIEVDTSGLIPSMEQLKNIATSLKETPLRLNGFEINWNTDSIENDRITELYGAPHDFWKCEIKTVGPRIVKEIDPDTRWISPDGTEKFGEVNITSEEYDARVKQGPFT